MKFLSVFASLFLAASTAVGANITWSTGSIYNGPLGFQAIDGTGSQAAAVNLNGAGNLNVDPLGLNITFQPLNQLNGGVFASGDPGTLDTNFNAIINTTDFNIGNVTLGSFLSGLTTGRDYQIQFFASDARACCSTRTQFFSDGAGNNSPTITQGTFTSILGTFTADATTQAIGLSANSNAPVLSAYNLRDVTGTYGTYNGSFENPNIAGATSTAPIGWIHNGVGVAGTADQSIGFGFNPAPDGEQWAFLSGGAGISQQIGAGILQANQMLDFSFTQLEQSNLGDNGSGVQLGIYDGNPLLGGLLLDSVDFAATGSGNQVLQTASLETGPLVLGDDLFLQFLAITDPDNPLGTSNVAIDNLQLLSVTNPTDPTDPGGGGGGGGVPEPASIVLWSLLGLVGLVLVICKRKRTC